MAEILLKDWYDKDQKYNHDTLFVRNSNGELVQFTEGTGEPTLEELEVTENGTYTPSDGVDGFGNVVVNVPDVPAVLQEKTITENGTYTADDGYDGFGSVTVEVEATSADVRYVTFKSYDGLTEYGKKAVAVGDDCADPIARGVFVTPTRESDAQYNYTHNGWATEANSAADADWNKSITEDKTVYAAFNSALRYYTITYYDDDGTTVLKTESLAYGSMPSYTPTKDGYNFMAWTPDVANVTEDASYVASWAEQLDFNACSWSKINSYAKAGTAATVFKVGDTKTFKTQQNVSVTAKIIGFNHDDLSDGTGKAGITLMFETSFGNQYPITSTTIANDYKYGAAFDSTSNTTANNTARWDNCDLRGFWNNTGTAYMLSYVLPASLKSVIKQVTKKVVYADTEYESDDYIWLPSISELGFTDGEDEGERYEFYTDGKVSGSNYDELIRNVEGTACSYRTRSKYSSGVSTLQTITKTGARTTDSQGGSNIATFPCFCI